jgi:hypothetical protein
MTRYRRLSLEELEGLKDEFVKFLIVQGIDSAQWVQFKVDNPVKAEALIDSFSDFIWDGIVKKVEYLEAIDSAGIKLYKCEQEHIFLTMIASVDGFHHNFKDFKEISEIMRDNAEQFQLLRAQKAYSPSRGEEIFRLIDVDHAYVTTGEMFEQFKKVPTQ